MVVGVTGSEGFLGKYLVEELLKRKHYVIKYGHKAGFDLLNVKDCKKVAQNCEVIIHLAAKVGGIGANRKYPYDFFYENLIMGTQLFEEARKAKIKKFVTVGTICSYPKYTPTPFKEHRLWAGYPEETNAPYGLAKKMLLVQGQAARQQYGFSSIHLLQVNLYGLGDNFDSESSHVIPAMITKFYEAKKLSLDKVTLWGTGTPTREFLYVEDAARGIVDAMEHYDKPEPINLGSGMEISIKDLAETIKDIIGYKGVIVWNKTQPDGQPRRNLDVSKAKREFGFVATTSFQRGIRETIKWYESTQKANS